MQMHLKVYIFAYRSFTGPLNDYIAPVLKWLQLLLWSPYIQTWEMSDLYAYFWIRS